MKDYKDLTELTKDLTELIKENTERLKENYASLALILVLGCLLGYINYKQNERLDEHKKVIELQQKQINQLIIHCEYERNRKNNN